MKTSTIIAHLIAAGKQQPLSQSEIMICLFLLLKAERQAWRMPMAVATSELCHELGISRATLCRSREQLKKRGLLHFDPGPSVYDAPSYTLPSCQEKAEGEPSCRTDETREAKNEAPCCTHETPCCTDETQCAPVDIYNNINNNYNHHHQQQRACEEEISLSELKGRLEADEAWRERTLMYLRQRGDKTLDNRKMGELLDEFFMYLGVAGPPRKTEKDCRSHFVNWMMKQQQPNKQTSRNEYYRKYCELAAKRRGTEPSSCSPEDYLSSF